MEEEKKEEKPVEKKEEVQEEPSAFKTFYVNFLTGVFVILLLFYAPFTENLLLGFLFLLFIIWLNFGITYMMAVSIALYVPTFVSPLYAFIASRAFIVIGFVFAAIVLIRGIRALFNALGTGIGEKMEEAKPTPPTMETIGGAAEEIGKKTGEMIVEQGPVTAGAGKGAVRRTSNSFAELAKKFRELMNH